MPLSLATTIKQRYPHITVVGEAKTFSPFTDLPGGDRTQQVKQLDAHPDIDIISIHTCHWWHGSFEWLVQARFLTSKPILAKGFHDTIKDVERALDAGADHVLTVGWWPEGESRCWHECESFTELASSEASMRVWNARNPRTGAKRCLSISQILDETRAPDGSQQVCQASMIRTVDDVDPRVNAVLIGEGLWT